MSDRIKLAEAMGWTHIHMKYVAMDETSYPFGCPPAIHYADNVVDKRFKEQIPDPFTDANDDYAVLEWSREQHFVTYLTAFLDNEYSQDYQIGDYARAALKVIE